MPVAGGVVSVLTNPWLVGIVGGVLSGAVVTFLSRFFLSKREKREYYRAVNAANQEFLFSLRPGIAEGTIPTLDVFARVASATARKHGVKAAHLYSAEEVVQELSKEIMDSTFLSPTDKHGLCLKVAALIQEPETKQVDDGQEGDVGTGDDSARYRERMTAAMSGMLGIMATVITATGAFLFLREPVVGTSSLLLSLTIPLTAVAATLAVLVLMKSVQRAARVRELKRRTSKILERLSGGDPAVEDVETPKDEAE